MSSNIAKRKSEGEGTSTLNSTKRVQRSVECAKQFFRKEYCISICSGAIKIKNKKLFPRLLTLQTSADAIVRFTNIKEDGDIESHGKLLEREFMVHDKCYREYTRLPKDETVRCLKFHNKNANTTYYFFTISAYNNFLEFFWVKLSTKTSFLRYFSRPNRTTLFALQNIILIKPLVSGCWNFW